MPKPHYQSQLEDPHETNCTRPLEQSSWQPPEGWDDEDVTAAALNKAKSTLARWRRETRKQGRQVGPPFSYAGLGRLPIYNRAKRQEWLEQNGPKPPRKPRPRSRVQSTTVEITP
jgi:hypothetical protein